LKLLDVKVVDEENKIKVARKQFLEKRDRPFFKGFRKHRMVRVCKGIVDNFPCSFEREFFFVDKDA
jgi:hypothetical protein